VSVISGMESKSTRAHCKRVYTLRVQASSAFRLHWTRDEWTSVADTASSATTFGITFVDIPIGAKQEAPMRFSPFWTDSNSWGGHDTRCRLKSKSDIAGGPKRVEEIRL